jgi:hypothetical protein
MSFHQVPNLYKDNDTIYHYTTSETALSHILKRMALRLSPRSQSSDPIENTGHFFSYSGCRHGDGIHADALRLTNESKEILRKTKQVCFCRNNSIEDEKGMTFPPFEKYGFAKPRMWDQYGDKYKGVCLAFSLKKLLENASKINITGNDLNYLTYHDSEVGHHSIDIHKLAHDGYDRYKQFYSDYLIRRLFNKHVDYIHENEYRLCSFADGNFDYIDIKNALVGVIISNLSINPFLYNGFKDILTDYPNVDIQILSFSNQTLNIQSYESREKLLKLVGDAIKQKTENNEA